MNFEEVLIKMRQHWKVRRPEWDDECYYYIHPEHNVISSDEELHPQILVTDMSATDWAVVEEKKEFCLSDKVIRISYENPNNGCKLSDIQQFITKIKEIIEEEYQEKNIVSNAMLRISKCAGDRFK